jgi:hypothetical protein
MWALLFPWGLILQVLAILHFVRTRPDSYWLWIILFGGPIGALAYLLIEAGPDIVNVHHAFRFVGRNNRISQLKTVIIDNPAPGNYEELGDLLRDAQKFAEAREAYNHAITSRTDTAGPFYGRALCSLELNEPEAAIPDLERTLQIDPQHDYYRALGLLAAALTRAGQMERASIVWDKAVKATTASEIQYHYALFLRRQGRIAEAREWAQRLLAKKATLPRYLKRRERPWFRKASALLKQLPRNGSPAAATVA